MDYSMVFVAISSALVVLTSGQAVQVVDYPTAVRCAGLAQAASELEGGESRYGRTLADSALFWTLTAFQAADSRQISYVTAETDQRNARLLAVKRLSQGEPLARRQLQQCRQQTPRLN